MIALTNLLLPHILRDYMIATSIEMKKDQKLIEKVISVQKFERAKRSYRIYQVLKLIRRELVFSLKREVDERKLRETIIFFFRHEFAVTKG